MVTCCARGAQGSLLDSSFVWWTLFAESLLTVVRVTDELVCGETQEEHLRNLILRRSDVDHHGASCHSTSTRAIYTPCSSGSRIWTCRCSTSYQQSLDNSSSEGYAESHRPNEFTGREEDFQQWSKKTEAFFAGVIKESEMMLEGRWAADGNHDDSD